MHNKKTGITKCRFFLLSIIHLGTFFSSEEEKFGRYYYLSWICTKNATKWGHTFEHRMRILLIHGICHLLGYDHIKDEDYKVMKRKENAILKEL